MIPFKLPSLDAFEGHALPSPPATRTGAMSTIPSFLQRAWARSSFRWSTFARNNWSNGSICSAGTPTFNRSASVPLNSFRTIAAGASKGSEPGRPPRRWRAAVAA